VLGGVTTTVCPFEIPERLKVVKPSEYPTLNGPDPVKLKVSVLLDPLHIEPGRELIVAVGIGFTFTVALPEPVTVHPLASVTSPDRE
jgi:hypothetical protein